MEKTINHSELLNLLINLKGATICSLNTTTIPRMKKGGNPLANAEVKKVSYRINYQFGYSYENAVGNRLKGQGCEADFKAEPLKWGEWLVPNKVITHKGSLYGRFYRMSNSEERSAYFVDGREATESEVKTIKEFTYKSNGSNRQAEAGLVEHQVECIDPKFDSIDTICVNGVTYKVSHTQTAEAEVA